MLTIKIDMEMCRVCLKAGAGKSLFEEDLLEKFQEVTALLASPDDGFPSALCAKCLSRLNLAYDFRKQSIESETHLTDFIAQVNQEFQHKIPVIEEENAKRSSSDIELELLLESGYVAEEAESVPNTLEDSQNDRDLVEYEKIDDISMRDIIEDCQETDVVVKDENMDIEELDEELIEKIIEEDPPSYDEVDDSGQEVFVNVSPQEIHISGRSKRRENLGVECHYCLKCDKDFSTRTNLHRHMQTHDGQKPFTCSVCGNGFTQKGSLKQHMHLHTGERPFKCSFCERSFTQAKTLVNHTRRHTGEKPFPCPDCGMQFRQNDGLKRHMLRHLDGPQKIFHCTICDRQLLSKYSLENHMRKHGSGQREVTAAPKFKCTECTRGFLSQKTLEAHQRAHAGETPFRCTYEHCEAGFVRHSGLKSHMKRHEILIKNSTEAPIEVLEIADDAEHILGNQYEDDVAEGIE